MTLRSDVELLLCGKEATLLTGALILFDGYPFRFVDVTALRPRLRETGLRELTDRLADVWREACRGTGPLAHPDYAARAAKSIRVQLNRAELRIAASVLEVCAREFADDWGEFSIVATGNVARYGATIEDLRDLSRRIAAIETSSTRVVTRAD